MFISVEHYIAIFLPLKGHTYCNVRRSVYAISILVIVMCIVCLPILIICTIGKVEDINLYNALASGSLLEVLYDIFCACLYSIIPSGILFVLNMLILKKIKHSLVSGIIIRSLKMLKQNP